MNRRFLTITVIACGAMTVAARADHAGLGLDHDDHGNFAPVTQGTTAAACEDGVSEGFACRNVELLSRVPLADMQGGTGSDSWGWKDEANGRYYGIMGRSTGVSFVDVTDPEAPVVVGHLPSAQGASQWRDVKTYQDHAFIVADGIANHGMQVFDLTRLRGVTDGRIFSADVNYAEIGPAHNIAINEDSGYAYLVGTDTCAGGLHMVDIRTPQAPVEAGCYAGDGYTHDVQCVNYAGPTAALQGRELCYASNEDSLTIVDVTDKASPLIIGKLDYPMVGYSHQGWLSADHRYFVLDDELDEIAFGGNARTMVFDVIDPRLPEYVGAYFGSHSSIDHNLYVHRGFVYQANYQAGLRILRIEDLASARFEEVGYFDTYPENDARDFDGAWNVYPFFDNGTLLVSDRNRGLFVLRAALPAAAGQPINGRLSGLWEGEGLNDQGLTLLIGENDAVGPYAYFAWYLYLDGEPFWLAGSQPFEYGTDELVIPAFRLSGLQFLVPDGSRADKEATGALTIHPHGCNHLHVEYSLGELGTGEVDFHRLATVEGRECGELR